MCRAGGYISNDVLRDIVRERPLVMLLATLVDRRLEAADLTPSLEETWRPPLTSRR